ncbi:hypothetical protein HII28_10925 [Planctomonas sp. JC2975]|uniref:hypothetical protein n=1 Tax=Planctomonas sp. JC2975 TaxID=2729626 RepID=UPI001474A43A|nr:hypothetical protein [Planctomonas sp. JC2975]NNC12388.1 hypothetical protein [Planctomonas sp. JC2975]
MNGSAESPAGRLSGTARLAGAKAARLAADTNAAAQLPNLGVVNCPMDDASHLDVYYWDSTQHIRVRYWTSGCETASNGGLVRPSIARSNLVPELEQLIPGHEPGTISGSILQFGGPVAADGTQPTPRPAVGIVAIYRRSDGEQAVSGTPVREVRTAADGTFSCTVDAGKYFVVAESLDGTPIVRPQPITLEAGGSPDIILGVDVP